MNKKAFVLAAALLLIPACQFGKQGSEEKVQVSEKQEVTCSRLAMLDTALNRYKELAGKYPDTLEELVDGPSKPEFRTNWDKPLLKSEDLIDAWGLSFSYSVNPPDAVPPYELFSYGERGPQKETSTDKS